MIDVSGGSSAFALNRQAADIQTLHSAKGKFIDFRKQVDAQTNEQAVEKVAEEFEALFISQMLGQMFGESAGEGAFGSKETSESYQNMVVEQYGKEITAGGGIGIASYIKTELMKLQEVE